MDKGRSIVTSEISDNSPLTKEQRKLVILEKWFGSWLHQPAFAELLPHEQLIYDLLASVVEHNYNDLFVSPTYTVTSGFNRYHPGGAVWDPKDQFTDEQRRQRAIDAIQKPRRELERAKLFNEIKDDLAKEIGSRLGQALKDAFQTNHETGAQNG